MSFDDSSSDLSSVPSSPLSSPGPSPPPEPSILHRAYPSPPRSQESSLTGSPCPDDIDSTAVMSERDGPPPAKRRKIAEPKEPKQRTTAYLDLRKPDVAEDQLPILDRLVRTLHKKRKIVVVAGAGISVSAGIPDFRSSTGLFTSLRQEHNLKGSGKDLFDASVYKDDSSTSSFHDMVRNMSKLTKGVKPTKFHHMLATLAQDDRLLRLYTQNIDGLDTGLEPLATTVPLKKENGKWPKAVQLHGGLDKMVCSKCGDLSNFDADLFNGPLAPVCATCVELDRVRTDIAGKRSHGIGRLRPRMVLYNEHNPDDEAIGALTQDDMKKRPDAIIVVGTSLKIPGVKRIVREMCNIVRGRKDGVAIWINNDPEPTGKEFEDCWDIVVRGTCDAVAKHAALRYWWEKQDSEEPTQEQWNKAIENSVEVVINKTYKAVPTTEHFRKALPSPTFSPIASRTVLEVSNSFSEEDELVATPPTPSKSPKKASAFDELKKKGTKQTGPKAKTGKTSSIKYVKKAVSKAAAGKAKTPAAASKKAAAKPQAKINQTFKQTKATSAAAKRLQIKTEGAAMQPLPSKDSRVNVSPTNATSTCPGLSDHKSPKKATDKRMSIESILG